MPHATTPTRPAPLAARVAALRGLLGLAAAGATLGGARLADHFGLLCGT